LNVSANFLKEFVHRAASGADLATRARTNTKQYGQNRRLFQPDVRAKASDLHLASGNNPMLRINGELQRVEHAPLENDDLKKMLYEIAPEFKIKQFEETGDVDFGYEIPNIFAFRANFFNQKHG